MMMASSRTATDAGSVEAFSFLRGNLDFIALDVPEPKVGEEVDGMMAGWLRNFTPGLDRLNGSFRPLDLTEDEGEGAGVEPDVRQDFRGDSACDFCELSEACSERIMSSSPTIELRLPSAVVTLMGNQGLHDSGSGSENNACSACS